MVFDALINFDFKTDASNDYEFVFHKYDSLLNQTHENISILSYISSHDDSQPFDIERKSLLNRRICFFWPGRSTDVLW